MLLDVPFLPDDSYVTFLKEHEDSLYSVHYSLGKEDIADGRHKTEIMETDKLSLALSGLTGVKKYALLNSRFHHPETYLSSDHIRRILNELEVLLQEGNIDGIVVVDFYLVGALSDASPEITGELEAVFGINCMLDSFERIQTCLNAVDRTNFVFPTKLNLDRMLNRRLKDLTEISARCRRHYPEIRLTLLANEGCLLHCPFKLSHDAHIAYANTAQSGNNNFEINRNFGCIRILSDHPEEIFRSPFIRPEDQKYYSPYADVLKICGRTLGPGFLKKTIRAFIKGEFEGNLLALLDTQDWQADRLELANSEIPGDYLERLTSCGPSCRGCDYCRKLFARIGRIRPVFLKDLRNPEPAE